VKYECFGGIVDFPSVPVRINSRFKIGKETDRKLSFEKSEGTNFSILGIFCSKKQRKYFVTVKECSNVLRLTFATVSIK